MAWVTPSTRTTGDLITAAIWNQDVVNNTIALTPAGLSFVIDGGGAAITIGEKGHVEIPFKCDIARVRLLGDKTGSIQVDIWKDTYDNFPPTDADSITGSSVPAISSAQKYEDSSLSGWITGISAGDILAFYVDLCSDITRCTVALKFTRS